jgi:hypothetical protein
MSASKKANGPLLAKLSPKMKRKRDMKEIERAERTQQTRNNLQMLRWFGRFSLEAGVSFDDTFGRGKREMAKQWHVPVLLVAMAEGFGTRDGLRPDDIPEFQAWLERHQVTFDEVRGAFAEAEAE